MPQSTTIDLVGKKFGRLLCIAFMPDENPIARFLFFCDCGTFKTIQGQSVKRGMTLSCGCLHNENGVNRATHGHNRRGSRDGTYSTWRNMMDRCEWGGNKPCYAAYGARGIRVCERWHDFANFIADMGERPLEHSIDRFDNSLGYEPSNCRWATRLQQSLNTSRTIKVKIDGEIVLVFDLVKQLGLGKAAIRSRAARRGNDYVMALRSVGVECDYADK